MRNATRLGAAIGLGMVALGASLWLLWRAPRQAAQQAVVLTSAATASALPTSTHIATATPRVTVTATPTVSPTATNTPTRTLTPTLMPSTTPTCTPIHAPATGNPTRLQAPAVKLNVTLYLIEPDDAHRVPDEALDAAVYHLGSAKPGHPGNVIISGPADVINPLLQPLQRLAPGDKLYVWVGVVPYRYVVREVWRYGEQSVSPGAPDDPADWFADTEEQWLTVIAGWPCEATSGCTVLRAVPAPWDGEEN